MFVMRIKRTQSATLFELGMCVHSANHQRLIEIDFNGAIMDARNDTLDRCIGSPSNEMLKLTF